MNTRVNVFFDYNNNANFPCDLWIIGLKFYIKLFNKPDIIHNKPVTVCR